MPSSSIDAESSRTVSKASFYLGSSTFSVYEEMSRQLLSHYFTSAAPIDTRTSDSVREEQEEKRKTTTLSSCQESSTTVQTAEEMLCGPQTVGGDEEKEEMYTAERTTSTTVMKWVKRTSKAQLLHCDLVLGDRFDISYAALRCAALSSSSPFQGIRWVNYFQGSGVLTLKASMTRLLKTEEPAEILSRYFPISFVLGGDMERRKDERDAFLDAVQREEEAYEEEQQKEESTIRDRRREEEQQQLSPSHSSSSSTLSARPLWILKPSAGAKGTGIQLVQGVKEARRFIEQDLRKQQEEARIKAPRWMAQSYVLRPLLLPGRRKFDIRVWALLQSPYTIYAYAKGSCRTTSVAYDGQQHSNLLSHLTNHCLQEGGENFGAYEEGNEMFFPAFAAFLSTLTKGDDGHYFYDEETGTKRHPNGTENANVKEKTSETTAIKEKERCTYSPTDAVLADVPHPAPPASCTAPSTGGSTSTSPLPSSSSSSSFSSLLSDVVWPQIATIITRTLLLLKPTMKLLPSDEEHSFRCFQLFGYDFMLDDRLQVKLLEINGSPGLAERYLSPVVSEMIQRLYVCSASSSSSSPSFKSSTETVGDERANDDGRRCAVAKDETQERGEEVQYPLWHRIPVKKKKKAGRQGSQAIGGEKKECTTVGESAAEGGMGPDLVSPLTGCGAADDGKEKKESNDALTHGVLPNTEEHIGKGGGGGGEKEKKTMPKHHVTTHGETEKERGGTLECDEKNSGEEGSEAGEAFPPLPPVRASLEELSDREWSLEKDRFILLWKDGVDPLPEGMNNME